MTVLRHESYAPKRSYVFFHVYDNDAGTLQVTIAADPDVDEGSPATFTLTRTGDLFADLTVNVEVSETPADGSEPVLGEGALTEAPPATATFSLLAAKTPGSSRALPRRHRMSLPLLGWALRNSSSVGEGVHHWVVQGGGEFLSVSAGCGQ